MGGRFHEDVFEEVIDGRRLTADQISSNIEETKEGIIGYIGYF